MAPPEKPALYLLSFGDEADAARRRAEQKREQEEARGRYVDYLAAASARFGDSLTRRQLAAAYLDALTMWNDVESGEPCVCSCHPRLPYGGFHDAGFRCVCRQPHAERTRWFDEWMSGIDEFWASPEGQALKAEEEAEKRALEKWLAAEPGVTVHSHGGCAPEQWWGVVDGHSFYFRERHELWRIELDLRPTGRFVTALVDGGTEERELEEGDVIADGTAGVAGYGEGLVGRIEFIVRTIRRHLGREDCDIHTAYRESLEALLGRSLRWCPDCGVELAAR
ncbi:MAG: hypothetical protein M3203_16865 [Actinomycetota bacterium]|nr:hypothetical protein [Actinomycetota bacterium]